MNILAVIPARGGSKGIPRKNVRFLHNKPLISYSIENAIKCSSITHIVLTTDDQEVKSIAKKYDILIIDRCKELSEDNVTLDPVVYDALIRTESYYNIHFDAIITLQPTSPLLTPETLNRACSYFFSSNADTVISVVNAPHLAWKNENGEITPTYSKRLNRQYLPPYYSETGAFLISKREVIQKNSRFGFDVKVFEVPADEATDIDCTNDWALCESILNRKKIIFRVDGCAQIGLGHIYRALTLAYALTIHEITFVSQRSHTSGIDLIKQNHFRCVEISSQDEFFYLLRTLLPDIVVIDCLDNEREYIQRIKELVSRVVTFEDLGSGREVADAVINALYDAEDVSNIKSLNVYSGEKYVCLRNEFLLEQPSVFHQTVTEILVIFGGSDPAGLTKKLYLVARKMIECHSELNFKFILGPANTFYYEVCNDKTINQIEILRDVKNISEYMRQADLAITSQGRTVYELACIGVPSIVLAQNEREQLHRFAQMSNGFLNLGLGKNIDISTIIKTIEWLIQTPFVREEMRKLMLSHDLKSGINRTKSIILGEF